MDLLRSRLLRAERCWREVESVRTDRDCGVGEICQPYFTSLGDVHRCPWMSVCLLQLPAWSQRCYTHNTSSYPGGPYIPRISTDQGSGWSTHFMGDPEIQNSRGPHGPRDPGVQDDQDIQKSIRTRRYRDPEVQMDQVIRRIRRTRRSISPAGPVDPDVQMDQEIQESKRTRRSRSPYGPVDP